MKTARPESSFVHRGLRVIHQRLDTPLTAVALAVRAGARFDRGRPGLAHLTEHMLFQGTTSLDQVTLNRRAAELGGEHNADTGYEDIALTFEAFNEDVDDALALLAEQYYRTEIDDRCLRKERRVVLEEIRGRQDDPADRTYQRAWSRLFGGSLAHPVCGTIASVGAIDAADVRGFFRRHFTHPNTVLAIVGGIDRDTARSMVARHFRHGSPGPRHQPPPACVRHSAEHRLRNGSGNQSFVSIVMAVPPEPRSLLATGVALDVVGADPDSRLFQEVRERLGLSYEVSASLEWGPDWAAVSITASASRSQARRLLRTVTGTLNEAAESGFAADEIDRARKKIRYRHTLLSESRLERALALAECSLLGMPHPDHAVRMLQDIADKEIESQWRNVCAAPRVTALLV